MLCELGIAVGEILINHTNQLAAEIETSIITLFYTVFCPSTEQEMILDLTYLQFFCAYDSLKLSTIFLETQEQLAEPIRTHGLKISRLFNFHDTFAGLVAQIQALQFLL